MQSQTLQLNRPSAVYDKKNSILVLWVSYAHVWTDHHGRPQSNINYYLKYQKEGAEYNGPEIELVRAFKILKQAAQEGRRIKTAILYQNWNKGSVSGQKNPEIFKLTVKGHQAQAAVPSYIDGDDNGYVKAFVEEQLNELIPQLRQ